MIGFISIQQIIDDIHSHPLLANLTLERAVNYTVEFLRLMGCGKIFTDKSKKVEIKDYRGLIPCDAIEVIMVRAKKGNGYIYMVPTSSVFYTDEDMATESKCTYKISGRVIYTSIKEGEVEIAYKAMPVDDDGFPLIPDNQSLIKALELYIKKEMFTILFEMGFVHQYVFNDICQEYTFYAAQAKNSLEIPNYSEMQNLMKNMSSFIIRPDEHKNGFKDLNR